MFFIKSCTQSFMTRIYFYKLFLINKNKNTEYMIMLDDYPNVIKFMKIISNSTHNRQKTQKGVKRQKKN